MRAPQRIATLPPGDQIGSIAAITEGLIERILAAAHASDHIISPMCVVEVATCFLNDLYRMSDQGAEEMSLTKVAAHWSYWIQKIKPIAIAYDTTHLRYYENKKETEIFDVNEQVALELAIHVMITEGHKKTEFARHAALPVCPKGTSCNGTTCLQSYAIGYFAYKGRYFEQWIKFFMQRHEVSPHHITMMLDQMIFAACRPDLK